MAERIDSDVKLASPLSVLRKTKRLRWSIAGASALGLVLGLALPVGPTSASALAMEPEFTDVKVPSQSFSVSADAVAQPLVRDSYSATSMEELQAKRQAEENARLEAEKVAQEEAAAKLKVAVSAQSTFVETPPATSYSGDAVIAYAEQFVGVVPYGWGNDPSDSFSCDGLVQYVYKQFGISLPRGVTAQASTGIRISPNDAQAGDLVVWPGEHIGIYDGHGGIIHSPDFGRKVAHASGLWGSYYFVRIAG